MIHPSRKLILAFDAVLYIAYNGTVEPVSSKEIAERLGTQQRYLEQIMQKFVHHGLLKGIRGPRGGYVLAKERRRISLGHIYEILADEDQEALLEEAAGTRLGREIVLPVLEQMRLRVTEELHALTLEDLCADARERGIEPRSEQRMDFII